MAARLGEKKMISLKRKVITIKIKRVVTFREEGSSMCRVSEVADTVLFLDLAVVTRVFAF